MRVFTGHPKSKRAYVLDVDFYKKNVFSPPLYLLQSFYAGKIEYEKLLQEYIAYQYLRYDDDPSAYTPYLKQDLYLIDGAPEKYVSRKQSPRYLAARWLALMGADYEGDV